MALEWVENHPDDNTPGYWVEVPDEDATPGAPPAFDTKGGTLVDPNSPGASASSIAATLLRAQFTDWQKTFQPIELSAIKRLSFNNPDVLPEAVNTAKETTANTYGAMRGALDRQNAALGVIPTEQQTRVGKRLINLNETASIAGAANTARDLVRTQDEQIILGASPNPNILKQQ